MNLSTIKPDFHCYWKNILDLTQCFNLFIVFHCKYNLIAVNLSNEMVRHFTKLLYDSNSQDVSVSSAGKFCIIMCLA